ncbi:hypothetical protein [Oscillatoria sp. FACHB-1406]|uniref:hypothetical protein n=1 Tax=Oscillatoria sp. FACHB-1406 TaxID=2692846 RepID=UPI001685C80E|nr:hypothetical protein [Oscillatoria sp. FACHB-1406]MBD2580160.1 hypothetical protein [Oscillatoria sp. FACHB-1406]
MVSYTDWNQALADYFVRGVARGTYVYLSVDEDVLERIGNNFDNSPIDGKWSHDFRRAVRDKVIFEGQVNLKSVQGHTPQGLPQGIAFLGATVLAAYRMAEEEKIDQNNYFRRLQEVLFISPVQSCRPRGMKPGDEEPLWQEWKRWLMEQGFLTSAQQGEGPTKYISYPISQSLLRRSDKERLCQLFKEKQWHIPLDAQILITRIRQEASRLTRHLKDLLAGARSAQRYEAIAESIHELYEQWRDNGFAEGKKASSISTRNLFAGLYRAEEPFLGEVEYYLYPKQPRGLRLEQVEVWAKDNLLTLREERPGWYLPEIAVGEAELESGVTYPIPSPDLFSFLILPQRDFWVLTPDPENPDSGIYASWGRPTLGDRFILLCKAELLPQLELLRTEGLLQWNGEPDNPFGNSDWIEINQCMVISKAWSGVFIQNQELYEALKPAASLSISLSGGLREPNRGAWLAEYGPKVTVFGFYPNAKLKVTRLSDGHPLVSKSINTNVSLTIEFIETGDYLIEASCSGESTELLAKIINCNQLSLNPPQEREYSVFDSFRICGSIIKISAPH